MSNSFHQFAEKITDPVKYRLFLIANLPSAYFAGIKIRSLTEQESHTTVPYKWFNKNPFRSTYFAVLAMAAEMSTGVLCMAHISTANRKISMLVVNMQASYFKKATGTIRFVCASGDDIKKAILQTTTTGEGVTVPCIAKGYNAAQELVCEFQFVWSLKAKTI